MRRLNRTWLGCLFIALGVKILPPSVRDEWGIQFARKTIDLPHQFDTSRFDG